MPVTRPSQTSHERVGYSEIELRRVVIKNSHGEKLVGVLHDTGSTEIVVICHGFRSSMDRIPMVTLARVFAREKISSFRFDFAGNGESEGSFQYGNYWREAEDLRSVLQHLRRENHEISAIVGHSKGGNVVLLYAAKYKDVETVVNISGRFFLDKGIEGRLGKDYVQRIKENGFIDVKNRKGKFEYRVSEESLKDRLTTDTRAACLIIHKNCRVLTVHGSADGIVSVTDASEFAKTITNHQLQIIDEADHEFTSHQHELASIVLSFVKPNVNPKKDKAEPDDTGTSQQEENVRSVKSITSRM